MAFWKKQDNVFGRQTKQGFIDGKIKISIQRFENVGKIRRQLMETKKINMVF